MQGSKFRFCIYCFCFYISTEKNKKYQPWIGKSIIAFSEASTYFGKSTQSLEKRTSNYLKMLSELQRIGFRSALWSFASPSLQVQEEHLVIPKIELSEHGKHLCIDISRSIMYQPLLILNTKVDEHALVIGRNDPDLLPNSYEKAPGQCIGNSEASLKEGMPRDYCQKEKKTDRVPSPMKRHDREMADLLIKIFYAVKNSGIKSPENESVDTEEQTGRPEEPNHQSPKTQDPQVMAKSESDSSANIQYADLLKKVSVLEARVCSLQADVVNGFNKMEQISIEQKQVLEEVSSQQNSKKKITKQRQNSRSRTASKEREDSLRGGISRQLLDEKVWNRWRKQEE